MISGHLLSAADLSKDEALNLLSTAKELAAITDGPNKKLPTLRGKTIVKTRPKHFKQWELMQL